MFSVFFEKDHVKVGAKTLFHCLSTFGVLRKHVWSVICWKLAVSRWCLNFCIFNNPLDGTDIPGPSTTVF